MIKFNYSYITSLIVDKDYTLEIMSSIYNKVYNIVKLIKENTLLYNTMKVQSYLELDLYDIIRIYRNAILDKKILKEMKDVIKLSEGLEKYNLLDLSLDKDKTINKPPTMTETITTETLL